MRQKFVLIGQKVISLPGECWKSIDVDNLKIVLILYDDKDKKFTDEEMNRNVIAYKPDGDIAWRIEEVPMTARWKGYSNIWINQLGQLMAGCSVGGDLIVDPKTGRITFWRDPSWPPDYKPRPW
jgi:hypothetical protein